MDKMLTSKINGYEVAALKQKIFRNTKFQHKSVDTLPTSSLTCRILKDAQKLPNLESFFF